VPASHPGRPDEEQPLGADPVSGGPLGQHERGPVEAFTPVSNALPLVPVV
jgi:hypothetical protein